MVDHQVDVVRRYGGPNRDKHLVHTISYASGQIESGDALYRILLIQFAQRTKVCCLRGQTA